MKLNSQAVKATSSKPDQNRDLGAPEEEAAFSKPVPRYVDRVIVGRLVHSMLCIVIFVYMPGLSPRGQKALRPLKLHAQLKHRPGSDHKGLATRFHRPRPETVAPWFRPSRNSNFAATMRPVLPVLV